MGCGVAVIFTSCLLREPILHFHLRQYAQMPRMDHDYFKPVILVLFFYSSSLSSDELVIQVCSQRSKVSLEEVGCKNCSNKRVLQDERAFLFLPYLLGLCAVLYGVKAVRVMKCKSKTLSRGKEGWEKVFNHIIGLFAILALILQNHRMLFKCLYTFSHCELDFGGHFWLNTL